jgi:hypothetical protein
MANEFKVKNGLIISGSISAPEIPSDGTSNDILVIESDGTIKSKTLDSGTSGSSGTSGTSGTNGTSGTSGATGANGTSGSSGTSGTSGTNGTSGTSGATGANGTSGSSGTSGTSGILPLTGTTTNGVITYDGDGTGTVESNLTFTGTTLRTNSTQTRAKFSVWTDDNYVIGMKNGYDYGHLGLGEYAMSFQMNDADGRGFWWGDVGHTDDQGAMALTTNGRLVVARTLSVGEGENITSPSSTPLYVEGSGSTIFDVQGSVGQLFSVTDDLTGTIFAVSDISGIPIFSVNASGDIEMNGPTLTVAGTITETSAKRFKKNIISLEDSLSKVLQLNPVEFDWIRDDKHDIGLIAEEVNKILPSLVQVKGEEVQGIHYSRLTAVLIGAIQELTKRVEQLENK